MFNVKSPTGINSEALPVFAKVNSLLFDSKTKVALWPLVEEVSTKSLACSLALRVNILASSLLLLEPPEIIRGSKFKGIGSKNFVAKKLDKY